MESWSVNERIRSAPGKGGWGSAIVLLLKRGCCLANVKSESRL
jgi:hypothetical protein